MLHWARSECQPGQLQSPVRGHHYSKTVHSIPLTPTTASSTSPTKRNRFSTLPPYWSVRWFEHDCRNWSSRYPLALCSSTPSNPAAIAFSAALTKSCRNSDQEGRQERATNSHDLLDLLHGQGVWDFSLFDRGVVCRALSCGSLGQRQARGGHGQLSVVEGAVASTAHVPQLHEEHTAVLVYTVRDILNRAESTTSVISAS